MKLRIIKDGFRYRCQYKKTIFWRNFKDKGLNNYSNLNVWFGNWEAAARWMSQNFPDCI